MRLSVDENPERRPRLSLNVVPKDDAPAARPRLNLNITPIEDSRAANASKPYPIRSRVYRLPREQAGWLIPQEHASGKLACKLAIQLNLLVASGQILPTEARQLQTEFIRDSRHANLWAYAPNLGTNVWASAPDSTAMAVETALGKQEGQIKLASIPTHLGAASVARALDEGFAVGVDDGAHARLLFDFDEQSTYVFDPLYSHVSGEYSQADALRRFFVPNYQVDIA